MGVMSCSRRNCENIMCRTYVDRIGYICSDCQSEFEDYLKSKNIKVLSEYQMTIELRLFMESDKDKFKMGTEVNVEDFFRSYTRD
jgi:hypothetical protein